jgi:hypothetical protein
MINYKYAGTILKGLFPFRFHFVTEESDCGSRQFIKPLAHSFSSICYYVILSEAEDDITGMFITYYAKRQASYKQFGINCADTFNSG